MDIIEAIHARKSIRGYKPAPVPKEVLRQILDIARRSPSGMNTQPWEITVITGKVLDNIKKGNVEKLIAGAIPDPDLPLVTLDGVSRQRQVDLAIRLFGLLGIAREDKEKRDAWIQRGFRFFDAPAVIILSMDRSCQEYQMNIGIIVQTICLAALNFGLGTCIQSQGLRFPEVVRKYAQIPESKQMLLSITIGYPDWNFPANKFESPREPLENLVTWCGFD